MEPNLWLHAGPRPVESGCQALKRKCRGLRTAPAGCSVGTDDGGVVGRAQGGKRELSWHPAYPPSCPSAVVVSIGKVLIVRWVDRPEVAFTVVAPARFDETVV